MRQVLLMTAAVVALMASSAVADYIDTTGPTGEYYQYAYFTGGNSVFKGGYDVDAYGNRIYVNRSGQYLDVYDVTLHDTDADGALEPDQHPDNPAATGPMEARTLSYVTTYSVPALDTASVGELYAANNGVYFLSQSNAGISFYNFGTGVTSTVVSSPGFNLSHLGYDDVHGKWYASNEGARRVYSWNGSSWQTEFDFHQLHGSHMDGLEVVTDPDTGIPYVYVSDMTSDYLGQWRYDSATSSWVEENLFSYAGSGAYVEGLGFGALGHFWATGSGALYEVGGGDLGGYIPPNDNTVPVPGAFLLGGLGTGLVGMMRRRRLA